jgi:pentatricopeptide repeat protein
MVIKGLCDVGNVREAVRRCMARMQVRGVACGRLGRKVDASANMLVRDLGRGFGYRRRTMRRIARSLLGW